MLEIKEDLVLKILFGAIIGGLLFGFVVYVIIWGVSLPSFTYQKLTFLLVLFFAFIFLILIPKDLLYVSCFLVFLSLPVLGIGLPPRRLGLFAFDAIGFLLFFITVYYKLFKNRKLKFFFNPFSFVPLLFLLPSFLSSIDVFNSFYIYTRIILYYISYILIMNYLDFYGYEGFARINFLLMFSLLIVCFFILIEKILGFKFALTGINLNAVQHVDGLQIKRAAGLFQDPQKAAQFIGCFFVYFLTLFVRNFYSSLKIKLFLLIVMFLSISALISTVSKLALVSTALTSLFIILVLNKFDFFRKLVTVCIFIILIFSFISFPQLKGFLPISVQKRFEKINKSMQCRFNIWEETWDMFKAPSLTGIGIGNYQKFLIEKKPYLKEIKLKGGYVPDQPENGYLKILYETGIMGLLGGIYFIIGILYFAFFKIFKSPKERSSTVALASLMGLFVFFSTFLTLYTVSDPRNALIPIIFFSFLSNKKI